MGFSSAVAESVSVPVSRRQVANADSTLHRWQTPRHTTAIRLKLTDIKKGAINFLIDEPEGETFVETIISKAAQGTADLSPAEFKKELRLDLQPAVF